MTGVQTCALPISKWTDGDEFQIWDWNQVSINTNIGLTTDNGKLILGAGQDVEIYYDGTNLIIDPNAVGSGKLLIGTTGNDTIRAKHESSDGSAGLSATYTFGGGASGDIATMTFKDGRRSKRLNSGNIPLLGLRPPA